MIIIRRVKVVGLSVLTRDDNSALCSSEEREVGPNAAMGNRVMGIIGRCR